MDQQNSTENGRKKIIRVYVDGCFDLVHYGHANALRQAKSLGDCLVAGVHSDEAIMKYKGRPVYNEQERYRLVKSIKWVDEIIMDAPFVTSNEFLDQHNCDFMAHGDDVWVDIDGSDPYGPVKSLNRFKIFKRTEGVSTTDLLSRILSRIRTASKTRATLSSQRAQSVESLTLKNVFAAKNIDFSTTPTEPDTRPCAIDKPRFSWTDGGMSYMPNILRITQFCSGIYSAYGPREPSPEDVVLYLPGSYDLFHIGHLSFFEKCLEFGNYLLVGIHSDSIATYENKQLGAIMTLQERILSVLACRYVCNIVIDAPYVVTSSFLDHFKVNYVVVGKNTDLTPAPDGSDPMKIPKQRGIFKRIDSGSSVTTATVIARILDRRSEYETRNQKKESKEAKILAGFGGDTSFVESSSAK